MIVCDIGANVKTKLEGFQSNIGTLGDWKSKITFLCG